MRDTLKEIREVLEVLVVGSILTALGNLLQMIKVNLLTQRGISFQSDPTQPGLLEISMTIFTRFQAFVASGCVLVLFTSVFINFFAIYYSAKNDDLLLSVRLILTGENVQRLVYTILRMANYLCTVFLASGCASDGIAGFIFNDYQSLFVVNALCQIFVSFNRFMAVSFDGMFYKYTTKQTLLQFIICYSIAVSLFCVSAFTETGIVNMYVLPTMAYFMVTMDVFTFLKLRKLSNSKASTAERRLMVQIPNNSQNAFWMIANSTYYFMTYFASSLISIVQYPFFGNFLTNVALQVNSTVSTCIYTLGLSYINTVFLKKKVSSSRENAKFNPASPQSVTTTMVATTKSSSSTPKI